MGKLDVLILPFLKFPSYVGKNPVLLSCAFLPCESLLLLIKKNLLLTLLVTKCVEVFSPSHQAVL